MASWRKVRVLTIRRTAVVSLLASLSAAPMYSQAQPKSLTFDKDVAPIIFNHCSSCHRPGQEAPFPLLNYADVKTHAQIISLAVTSRFMPPWKPVVGYGDLDGTRELTDEQIATIRDWVAHGGTEGSASDLPPAPKFSSDWPLGKPDLAIAFPTSFAVPADGPDLYHCFIVPVNIAEDRYVRAFDFRPTPPDVVHHVIVVLDPFSAARRLESSPGEGYSCYGGFSFPVPGYLGIWTAGATPKPEPQGVAKVLKKNSELVVQIHFHPSGKAESERPTLALYFQKEKPERIPFDVTLGSVDINIPPGDANYRVTDYTYINEDAELIGIIPHAHKLCREIKTHATLPDGTDVPLLWIKDWDFNWQEQYRYAKPVRLPQGTRIDAEWIYDNSDANPRNPNHPPALVTWGEGTNDEMAELHLELIAAEHKSEAKANSAQAPASANFRKGMKRFP
jgi:mono/diheme cytochrome c family protein